MLSGASQFAPFFVYRLGPEFARIQGFSGRRFWAPSHCPGLDPGEGENGREEACSGADNGPGIEADVIVLPVPQSSELRLTHSRMAGMASVRLTSGFRAYRVLVRVWGSVLKFQLATAK